MYMYNIYLYMIYIYVYVYMHIHMHIYIYSCRWEQMLAPPHSMHWLHIRWWGQMLEPPHFLHVLLRRWCGQMLAPPHSLHLHRLLWRWRRQMLDPHAPCIGSFGAGVGTSRVDSLPTRRPTPCLSPHRVCLARLFLLGGTFAWFRRHPPLTALTALILYRSAALRNLFRCLCSSSGAAFISPPLVAS
jgi:hypothetical protein